MAPNEDARVGSGRRRVSVRYSPAVLQIIPVKIDEINLSGTSTFRRWALLNAEKAKDRPTPHFWKVDKGSKHTGNLWQNGSEQRNLSILGLMILNERNERRK